MSSHPARDFNSPSLDFRALFEAAPTPFIVLAPPNYEVVSANPAYFRTTMTDSADLLGRPLFDALPAGPEQKNADAARHIREQLDAIVAGGRPGVLPTLRYDIPNPATGGFERRWWSQIVAPVFGAGGELQHLVCQLEDVTTAVQYGDESSSDLGDLETANRRLRQTIVVLDREVSVRRRVEEHIRRSAELDMYRVRLHDALRPHADPALVMSEALRVLGEHLKADYAYFSEVDEAEGVYHVRQNYLRNGQDQLTGRYPIPDYGEVSERLRRGETCVFEDTATDAGLNDVARRAMLSHGIVSSVSTSLVKEGRWLALLNVHSNVPRQWSQVEVALVEETAERTWSAVERARAELLVRQNAETFRNLVESVPFGMYVVDSDMKLVHASSSAHRSFKSVKRLIGSDLGEVLKSIYPEPFATGALSRFRHTLETGEPFTADDTVTPPAGNAELDSHDWRLERVVMPSGSYGVVCYYYDLTERRQLEELLRQGHERQAFLLTLTDELQDLDDPRAIMETACRLLGRRLGTDRVVMADVVDDFFVERACYTDGIPPLPARPYRMSDFGTPVGEEALKADRFVIEDVQAHPSLSPEQREAYAALQVAALARVPLIVGGRWIGALSLHQSHPRKWTEFELDLLREVAYRIWGAAERARADDELKRLNGSLEQQVAQRTEELGRSEEMFRKAFVSGPVAACMTTKEGDRFIEVNEAFEKLTGYTEPEVVGRSSADLRVWSSGDDLRAVVNGMQEGGGYRDLELQIVTKDNEVRDILASCEPVVLHGEPVHLKMFIDITDQKRRHSEVQRAIEETMAEATWFGRSVVERLNMARTGNPGREFEITLTPREQQVLSRIARGQSDTLISKDLEIALRTVKNHVSNIYAKLGVRSRSQAVVWAQENGLVE